MGVIRQFVTIRAHFLEETAGVQGAVAFARDGEPGGEEEEHVLGAGAGHVEEAALLLDVPIVDRAGQREQAVGHPQEEDDRELEIGRASCRERVYVLV